MRQIVQFASRRGVALALAVLASSLAACASAPPAARPGEAAPTAAAAAPPVRHDPLERVNRGLYKLGDAIDRGIIHPIVVGYRRIAPRPVRRGIHNVLQNLDEPVVFVNDVLQAHPKAAAQTAVRFVANSTVGVAGIFDAAETAGLPHHDNTFGSTLGRWGVGPGPYLFAPVFGPTTLRDAVGDGVDFVLDPLSWTRFGGAQTFGIARTGLNLLDDREQADTKIRELRETTVDPYASMRSVYLQSRQAEIKGTETPLEPLPELPQSPTPSTPPSTPPASEPAQPPPPVPSDQPAPPPPPADASAPH